jgi:hypothetical protein
MRCIHAEKGWRIANLFIPFRKHRTHSFDNVVESGIYCAGLWSSKCKERLLELTVVRIISSEGTMRSYGPYAYDLDKLKWGLGRK